MTTLYETDRPASQNGSSRENSHKGEAYLKPLIDCSCVEISQHLFDQTEGATTCELPDCEPDDVILEPSADELSDEDIKEHVSSTIYADSIITQVFVVVNVIRRACAGYKKSIERSLVRELKIQDGHDLLVPATKSANHKQGWLKNLTIIFMNWSSLAAGLLASVLFATIWTEIAYQIAGLRESSWGLVQSFFGAFGFTWGFTMAVVIATYWHSQAKTNLKGSSLNKQMARFAFWIAWIGLTLFGFMLGLMHSFEGDEGWLLPGIRCVLTTFSVVSLGLVCVAIETGVCRMFKSSYKWTLVENEKVKEKDADIEPLLQQRQVLEQIEELADRVELRVKKHVQSQSRKWISRRDEIRKENRKQEAIRAEQLKIQQAQQRLAGLN